jgi:hypothetical protein
MSEKDEVICLAHSSVDCSKKMMYSYETPRGCKLLYSEEPFVSTCQWRHIIKAPVKPEEPVAINE